jgi:hypothetical protein
LTLTGGGLGVAGNVHVGTAGQIVVSNAAPSTSSTTGALTVAGGLGVAGDVVAAKFKGDGSELTGIPWTESNSNIYYAANVAIGTSSVTSGARLEVDGPLRLTGDGSVNMTCTTEWTLQVKKHASDLHVDDYFGTCVDISGDGTYAIVGAYGEDDGASNNSGSAYVLIRSGTEWHEQQKLVASDAQQNDTFGFSVAINRDATYAVVSAYSKNAYAGAVYVFIRSGTTWTQQQKLTANDAQADDYFGGTTTTLGIDSDGNTIIIGATGNDGAGSSGANYGAAYVFTRSGTTWTQQQKLTATGSSGFGDDVAITTDGNTVIIGSPYQDTGATNAGSAYVFTRSGTTWSQQAHIQAGDLQEGANFGCSVALDSDGDTAIVGARGEDTGGKKNTGAAYVFTRSGTTWTQQAKIQGGDLQAGDNFGITVGITDDGNKAVVSASWKESGSGKIYAGAAYVFTRTGSAWSQEFKLSESDSDVNDYFGTGTISRDGNYIICGAAYADTDVRGGRLYREQAPGVGAIYIYNKPGKLEVGGPLRLTDGTESNKVALSVQKTFEWSLPTMLRLHGSYSSSTHGSVKFGVDADMSGNGDYAIVGDSLHTGSGSSQSQTGAVYVFTYDPGLSATQPMRGLGWTLQQQIIASNGVANDNFGSGVAFNRSATYAAIGANGRSSSRGALYVFTRAGTGTSWSQQGTMLEAGDGQAGDRLGDTGSIAIDLDGDTILVGAWGHPGTSGTGAGMNRGAVYMFTRSISTWSQTAKIVPSDIADLDHFGRKVDITHDGNMCVVSAQYADPSGMNSAGAAYVFTRSGNTWTRQAKLAPSDLASGDNFGWSVAIDGAGDTIVVGAPNDDPDTPGAIYNTDSGSAYVFTRSGTSWSQQAKLVKTGRRSDDKFGSAVSIAKNDGNRIVVSALNDDYNPKNGTLYTDNGAAYVFERTGTTWSEGVHIIDRDMHWSPDTYRNWGTVVEISDDGNRIIGTRVGTGSGDNGGHACVFDALPSKSLKVDASIESSGDIITTSGSGINAAGLLTLQTPSEWNNATSSQAYVFCDKVFPVAVGSFNKNYTIPSVGTTGAGSTHNPHDAAVLAYDGSEGGFFAINGDGATLCHPGDRNALTYIDEDNVHHGHFVTPPSAMWYITYNGSLTAVSDIRLKENIQEYSPENLLDKLKDVQVITYTHRPPNDSVAHKTKYTEPEIGLSAQNVLTLFPEYVDDSDTYYKMNYSKWPMLNTAAIKELTTQLEAEKAKVADLLARVTNLENA